MSTRRCTAAVVSVFVLGAPGAGIAWAATGSASTTGTIPPGKRLTTRQWQSFKRSYQAFNKTTQKTVKTFNRCHSSTAYSHNAQALSNCLGNSLQNELGVTQRLFNTLISFQGTVGSICNSGFSSYAGTLHVWQRTVSSVQTASRHLNLAAMESAIKNAQSQAGRLAIAEKGFLKVCAPA